VIRLHVMKGSVSVDGGMVWFGLVDILQLSLD
jgi:hypothetical protein